MKSLEQTMWRALMKRGAVVIAVVAAALAGSAIPAAAATTHVNKACYAASDRGDDGSPLVRFCTRATWGAAVSGGTGRHLKLDVSVEVDKDWPDNNVPYDCAYTLYGSYSNPAGTVWAMPASGKSCKPSVQAGSPGINSYYTWLETDTSADSVKMNGCVYLYDIHHNIYLTWCGGAPWTSAYADRDLGWTTVSQH